MNNLNYSAYYQFFNATKTLSFVVDKQGNIATINKIAKEKLSISNGRNIKDIEIIIDNPKFYNNLLDSFDTNYNMFEFEIRQANKNHIPYEISASKVVLDDNETYIVCNAHTVISKKEAENKILSAVIETEEKERSRFAKDLHDGLGPLLSTIKLYAHELNSNDNSVKEKEEYVNYIIDLIDDAVTNTREISNNLTPQIISSYGLVKSIESFVNKINATQKLKVVFNYRNIPNTIDKPVKLTLFRIVTELLNNSLKHAFANNINIELFIEKKTLQLIYKDDGIGFNLDEALKKGSSGIGLINIINRIKAMSGNFIFNKEVKQGVDMRFIIKNIT